MWKIAYTLVLWSGLVSGCATPATVLNLMDAQGDSEVANAVAEASAFLSDRGQRLEVRMAAAKTLGRLRKPDVQAILRLQEALESSAEPADLRSYAAWALGEMCAEGSLEALIAALRTPMDSTTGVYLLEGIAKHSSILSRNPGRMVDLVEAILFYADHQKQTLPGIYDVLSAKTRSLPVNTAVLARANDALSRGNTPEQQASVYYAVFELLTKLDQDRKELEASSESGSLKSKEAMCQIERALAQGDPYTKRFIVWYLGQMATTESLSRESIRSLFGASEPKRWLSQFSAPASLRLIAVWAVLRMLRVEPDMCQSLRSVLLNQEKDPEILRLTKELPCSLGDLHKEKAP